MQPRGDLPPCKFFAENTCRKGASCPFPHVRPSGPTHSNPSGNPHSFSRRPQGGPSYKKQKPYEQGRNEGMEMDANRREEHYMGGGGGRGRVGGREGGGGFGGGGAGGGAGGGGGGSGGSGGEGRRDPRSEDFSYCKFFRQGKCTRENCKLPHTWTDKDDIKLLLAKLLRDSGQQNSELRDACLLDKLEKKFVFSFPTCLKIVSFDKNEESDVKMSPDEEITCLRYNGFLFLGVCRNNINEIKICEFGKQEQIISPAHQDFITDILLVKNYVVSCAMDGKIKFWKWDFTGNKFVLALSQGSDYELRILKYENINGTDFLFAAGTENSENAPKGALLIFNLLANENEISLQLVSQMKDYHNGEITSMLIHLIGKSPCKIFFLQFFSFDLFFKRPYNWKLRYNH